MDDQDWRKPVDGHLFLQVVDLLAIAALVTAPLHGFWSRVAPYAFTHIHVTRVPDSLAGYAHTQVHEGVERVTFVAATFALDRRAQLPFEKVSDYRVVSGFEVVVPNV